MNKSFILVIFILYIYFYFLVLFYLLAWMGGPLIVFNVQYGLYNQERLLTSPQGAVRDQSQVGYTPTQCTMHPVKNYFFWNLVLIVGIFLSHCSQLSNR